MGGGGVGIISFSFGVKVCACITIWQDLGMCFIDNSHVKIMCSKWHACLMRS